MKSTTKKAVPKNANELTIKLMETFSKLSSNEINKDVAIGMSRLANTTISNLRVQLTYNKQMNKKSKIPFLEGK